MLDRVDGDPLYAPYKRRIVELVAPEQGGRYLELGCGTGADAVAFAERFGVGVSGLDRSRTMVAEARRRGVERAVVADAHRLPFASGSFDLHTRIRLDPCAFSLPAAASTRSFRTEILGPSRAVSFCCVGATGSLLARRQLAAQPAVMTAPASPADASHGQGTASPRGGRER